MPKMACQTALVLLSERPVPKAINKKSRPSRVGIDQFFERIAVQYKIGGPAALKVKSGVNNKNILSEVVIGKVSIRLINMSG